MTQNGIRTIENPDKSYVATLRFDWMLFKYSQTYRKKSIILLLLSKKKWDTCEIVPFYTITLTQWNWVAIDKIVKI